jgi:hypothetical protein
MTISLRGADRDAIRARARFVLYYLSLVAAMNLAWEIVQLPLYTIWRIANPGYLAFAVAHCTAGDILIAAASLLMAVLLAGDRTWPWRRYRRVMALAIVIGIAYTMFSEWLNVEVRHSWAYSAWMPVLPLIGTGLAPVMQWIILPLAAFQVAQTWLGRPFDPPSLI